MQRNLPDSHSPVDKELRRPGVMKFEYQKYQGDKGEALFMPNIPVMFRKPEGGTLGAYALVDSGAGRSFFDAEYAAGLGIEDVESGKRIEFVGITGHILIGYFHDVTLLVGGHPYPMSVAFCPDFPVTWFAGVLGQEDFFTLFRIRFVFTKKEIEIVPEQA